MKEIKKSKVTFSEVSKFPAVKRDLALLLDKNVQFAEIEKIATESERKLLKGVTLFDVYEGKGIEETKKSLAYSLTFSSQDKTLTDEEINPLLEKIVTQTSKDFGARLRE